MNHERRKPIAYTLPNDCVHCLYCLTVGKKTLRRLNLQLLIFIHIKSNNCRDVIKGVNLRSSSSPVRDSFRFAACFCIQPNYNSFAETQGLYSQTLYILCISGITHFSVEYFKQRWVILGIHNTCYLLLVKCCWNRQ